MNTGIIFYFRPKQQFGFVREDSGAEWFFHTSNSPDFTPTLGARVQFELAPPIKLGKRDQAINLRPVVETAALDAQEASDKAGA